jgi:hypothetical protein
MRLSDSYEEITQHRAARDKTARQIDRRTPRQKLADRIFIGLVWLVIGAAFAGLAGWWGQ